MSKEPIILIDSGWAGWSFKYYDFAYFILQMIGYANRMDDALLMLKTVRREFGKDDNFENLFKAAMFYRGMRLARELDENHSRRDLAERLIEFVRKHCD